MGVKASAFYRNIELMCNVRGKNSYKNCKEDGGNGKKFVYLQTELLKTERYGKD